MKKKTGVRRSLLMGALMVTIALSACSQAGGGGKNKAVGSLDREDEGSLKVAYFNEQAFYTQYGNAYQAMFPNIQLEVVSTENVFTADDPAAEMEKLLQERQPDVMFLTEDQYALLAKKGLLYDLDAAVKQDKFDLAAFVPSVIDLLKARGGGKLYGLSPDFSSQALYYNKDLFDKYGIPYPKDGMSWEEALQLTARFPVKKGSGSFSPDKPDDALYGLAPPIETTDPFELIRTIGEAKGLLYADSEARTVSIDTPEWKSIFQAVIDGYKSGSIIMPQAGGGGIGGMIRMGGGKAITFGPNTMRFLNGQAAMAIDDSTMMNMLGKMGQMRISSKAESGGPAPKPPGQDLNWDLATLPVDPSQPDVTGGMRLENVVSINASSQSLPAAWELVKYVNGEQLAKTSAKSSPALSSRTAYKPEAGGKNTGAFYALKVNEQSLLQTLPEGFADSFAQLATEQIMKVVDGSQSVEEALKTIQSQGQDLLTKAISDEAQG